MPLVFALAHNMSWTSGALAGNSERVRVREGERSRERMIGF